MLDMLYAFFLFWPANVIPVWSLLILLQLFIPFNMLLRSSCIGLEHYGVHTIAGVIVFAAVGISMLDFTTEYFKANEPAFITYTGLFFLCALFNALSTALKESIVRS